MTTTELIKILQDNEKGGISHKSRQISLTINGSLNALMATLYNKGYQDGAKALAEHHELCRDEVDGTDAVIDKIRTEIETQEKWLLQAGYNAYNVDIAFSSIKSVLAESEDKE